MLSLIQVTPLKTISSIAPICERCRQFKAEYRPMAFGNVERKFVFKPSSARELEKKIHLIHCSVFFISQTFACEILFRG